MSSIDYNCKVLPRIGLSQFTPLSPGSPVKPVFPGFALHAKKAFAQTLEPNFAREMHRYLKNIASDSCIVNKMEVVQGMQLVLS